MKNNILKLVFASAFALVAGYSVYASQKKVEMSDLAMANIEALASGENDHSQKIWERYYRPDGTGYNCTKTGNETC
ncbi:hypothetical protein BACCOP_04230 [Phocaeicola coprocola DSM 17136]|uniref:NVEALA protein n=1 Tax=Phocaeicola coprocola DSM 17136 TaxID=470145 RepID=B3JQJ4_9BACT|nr:NVEALA domain-containing protein [Phocaeicola coprocola]EDU98762.1 hypothetical protein BACCOP_04230 [Phocaeicola coprocola DSM 17136]